MKCLYCFDVIILGCFCGNLYAEIVTDGSLGTSGIKILTAPNYIISEDLGRRQGNNLFHSFSHFNVLPGETATFQADANVGNIFARVTGNELSTINGIISTAQSTANLWLMNPNGWLISNHARFDIHGALHITTANAIGFGQGDKFHADPKQISQLSIGTPLTLELDRPSQAVITIDQADLQLPEYQIVSFTAPKLNFIQTAITEPGGQILLGGLGTGVWSLDARQGLKGQQPANGEIILTGYYEDSIGGIKLITANKINVLTRTLNLDKANMNTDSSDNTDAGNITIQAEDMHLSNLSNISSNSNRSDTNSNSGDIAVILINDLYMTGDSSIYSYNAGLKGGTINVTADHINLDQNAVIGVNNLGMGEPGQLFITSNTLNLSQGGTFDSSTLMEGKGGDLNIKTKQLTITDPETFIASVAVGEGSGGKINIQSEQITVANHAQITASSEDTGDSGTIIVGATGQLRLDNAEIRTEAKKSDGGAIQINADIVFLRHGQITTSVNGDFGDGGDITIKSNNLVMDSGFIQANTDAAKASGGDIQIDAKHIFASGNILLVDGDQNMQYAPHSQLNVIQAAAKHGTKGNINLNTVELNIAGQLLPLDSRFLTQFNINDNPCQVIRGQPLSSLVAIGNGGLPTSAIDLVTTSLDHYLTPEDLSLLAPSRDNSFKLSCPIRGL